MDVLINIDVPDLAAGIAFYTEAFALVVTRRIGVGVAELSGLPARLYLIEAPEGSMGAGADPRRFARHWTPVHIDIVVDDLGPALARATAAGAKIESETRIHAWGKIAILADPFGHGFCLIQFLARGYDEISRSEPSQ